MTEMNKVQRRTLDWVLNTIEERAAMINGRKILKWDLEVIGKRVFLQVKTGRPGAVDKYYHMFIGQRGALDFHEVACLFAEDKPMRRIKSYMLKYYVS